MVQARSHRILLALSLLLNISGAALGGMYVYKTRHVLTGWYSRHVAGKSVSDDRRYYTQRTEVFRLLQPTSHKRQVIIFAGDSLIDTFEWGEPFADLQDTLVLNRGIGGNTLDDLIDRFDVTFRSPVTPDKVFLMVGINDIARDDFTLPIFSRKYFTLLESLAALMPRDRICVQSILPVRRDNRTNAIVTMTNAHLQSRARAEGFCYIDLHRALVDSTGQLASRYSLDGIHLTSQGYSVWLQRIAPYIAGTPAPKNPRHHPSHSSRQGIRHLIARASDTLPEGIENNARRNL